MTRDRLLAPWRAPVSALCLIAPSLASAQTPSTAAPAAESKPASPPALLPATATDAMDATPAAPAEPSRGTRQVDLAASEDKLTTPPPTAHDGKFEFGSYGRVQIASDLQGGTGRAANIVAHGTRLDEDSYAELELRREDTFDLGIKNKVVTTLALFPPFFHFSGDPTQNVGLRNLYDQATYGHVTMWIGSRMYRGDDIYLLDWWPLDNQNTVGGGVGVDLPATSLGETSVAFHVGMQRLDNAAQYEQIPVVAPFGVGTVNVTVLDRPRLIQSLKLTQLVRNSALAKPFQDDRRGLKFIVYGEAQEMSAGVYTDTTVGTANNTQTPYPSESGFLLGAEAAYWTGQRDTFTQLFVRFAHGLAAYDTLSEPTTFAADRTTSGANDVLVALGGNYERGAFGLLYGGYFRYFTDGDPQPTSISTYDEGTFDVRPQLFLGEHWGVAVDGSYQARRYAELNPTTHAQLTASEWRGGIMPYFSPSGRGSYKRPQLRVIYAVTARDAGARALYASQDVFSQRSVEHYLGLGVEWWFNSSSYP